MAKTKHPIRLSEQERKYLQHVYDGSYAKTKRQRAAILLRADENRADGGLTDREIAAALECSLRGIQRVRKNVWDKGLKLCVQGHYDERPRVRKITGEVEAKLIALCCSEPPEGRARWTLRLLADKLVELEILDSIDHSALHHCLKKNELKPSRKKQWCIPPKQNAAFVCALEDILEVYQRKRDARFPLLCLD